MEGTERLLSLAKAARVSSSLSGTECNAPTNAILGLSFPSLPRRLRYASSAATAATIHEYIYTFNNNDTAKLVLTDSLLILLSPDSLVTLTVNFPFREKSIYKKIHYFNDKKQIARIEEYKDDNLLITNEWKYDEKNRKSYHYEDNKVTGNIFKKTYDE